MLERLLVAHRDILHRQTTSVANGGITEVDRQLSIVEGDAHDPVADIIGLLV